MPMQFDEKFLEFLEGTPEMIAKFLDIINEFYKIQGEASQPKKNEEGPRDWHAGETSELITVGLSHEDLDSLAKGYAKAVVKEKAIAYIEGFISGVMLVT